MSDAGGAAIIQMSDVTRAFGELKAVNQLSLSIDSGEFVSLLGPSGCGKTTALRLIAGFEHPDEGSILFDGQDVTRWSPQKRGFGMVFQSYALFPHLNVFENVGFGLRARKLGEGEIESKVHSALEIVDLADFDTRAVQELSGGQQQRVALARALAIEPRLLLLDEPLSNLDQSLRVQTRNDLRRLVKDLGITALFVTHDQEEAFDLSDRIAVMNAGRIRQIGSPQWLYEEPADEFVASFVGRANVLEGVEVEGGIRLLNRVTWPLPKPVAGKPVAYSAPPGSRSTTGPTSRYRVVLRPEELGFVPEDDSSAGGPPLAGVIRDRRFRGRSVLYRVALSGEVDPTGEGQQHEQTIEVIDPGDGPAVGARVFLAPSSHARVHVFSSESPR